MISIYICSKYSRPFPKCAKSIADSATSDNYEIVVKVDSVKEEQNRRDVLENLGIKHTIVCNNISGYKNLHVMTNQAAAAAKGDLLWGMGDDCYVTGDWYGAFREVQKQNPDNIFVINTRVGRTWAVCPVISRGWYEVLGYVSACPTNDYFLKLVGDRVGRYLPIPSGFKSLAIDHQQEPGNKGISKSIRKPALKVAEKKSKGAAHLIALAIKDFNNKD